jgi:peptidoglycan hydrolase-like protein with peptidoglycan-binding domain
MIRLRSGFAVVALSALTACSYLGIGGGHNEYGSSGRYGTASSAQPSGTESSTPRSLAPSMVKQVQARLKQDGYYPQGNVDGIWGSATENAVAAFQRDHNLQAHGQLDTPTLQALNIPTNTQGGNEATGMQGNPPPANSGTETNAPPPNTGTAPPAH